jgi:hypothetical protein
MAFTPDASDFSSFFHRNSKGENPGLAPTASSGTFGLGIWLRECRGFSGRKRSRKPVLADWLGLLIGFRLDHNQQYDPKHSEHAKRGCLAVPRSGLPHQKPFATHSKKGQKPHQQT